MGAGGTSKFILPLNLSNSFQPLLLIKRCSVSPYAAYLFHFPLVKFSSADMGGLCFSLPKGTLTITEINWGYRVYDDNLTPFMFH